ncbi:hypothetical protein KA005_70980, partial [bacterium]|nr:hypothetical protein [bacterium]
LNEKLEAKADTFGNLNHVITAEEGGTPHNVEEFMESLRHSVESIQKGKWGKPILLTNVREMYPGMGAIYDPDKERILKRFGGNIDNLFTYIDPNDPARDRDHDLPGCMANLETLMATYTIEEIMKSVVLIVSDGGFNTRVGPITLANGYNGIVTLPGGKSFRQINLEVLGTVMKQLKNGLTDFFGWAASDNYTFFGNANWNNRPLSELPTEKATIIAVGKKSQVLLAEEQEWLEKEVRNLTDIADLRQAWEKIMTDATLQQQVINLIKKQGISDEINQRILKERLEALGILAVDMQEGTMSLFREKEKMEGYEINLKLVRAANQNGGYVYKNVFLEFLNKKFMIALYKSLHVLEMHDVISKQVIAKLDNLPVSFMQSILQSRFMGMKEWMESGVMP